MPKLDSHPGNFRFAIKYALFTIIFARIIAPLSQAPQSKSFNFGGESKFEAGHYFECFCGFATMVYR